jgi:uncharacterized BrkB/YihY/UPF0761 family membrane protein
LVNIKLYSYCFALVLTIGGFLQTIVWADATKNKLIDESLTHDEIHYILLGTIVSPAIFFIINFGFICRYTICILLLDIDNTCGDDSA